MALPGQASGDFSESSSALRILYIGVRNTFAATLATDGFTQTNPPQIVVHISGTLPVAPKRGVLGGSVCFTRGNGLVGGPPAAPNANVKPLGLFINDAAGNAYENTPAAASGQAPYTSANGTFGVRLYETRNLSTGDPLDWSAGNSLYASKNGYLTNVLADNNTFEQAVTGVTLIGVVKVAPDSVHAELVFDQRI